MIGMGKRRRAPQAAATNDRERMITLVNSLTDAVLSTDADGIVTIYNAAMANLLDTNTAITGQPLSQLLQLQTVDHQPIDIMHELRKSPSIRSRDDLLMAFDDDDQLRIEATFSPILGGEATEPDGFVLILRDITRVKSLEEERDEFISVVSHELRTPVAIAEGSLDNAKLLAERGFTDKVNEALEEAHRQVLFLARMVNDLSTLSRAERGVGDEPEVIDANELAAQLFTEYAPQAEAKGLVMNLDAPAGLGAVFASRLYLQELLQNFITNAIKYTQEGSLTLTIHKHDDMLTFTVSDTGIGISKADQQKIFDRFYRAEDYRTRETSGTGLGLYVAVKLCKKLGCRIDLKSRLNHGSAFSFQLPSHQPAPDEM